MRREHIFLILRMAYEYPEQTVLRTLFKSFFLILCIMNMQTLCHIYVPILSVLHSLICIENGRPPAHSHSFSLGRGLATRRRPARGIATATARQVGTVGSSARQSSLLLRI